MGLSSLLLGAVLAWTSANAAPLDEDILSGDQRRLWHAASEGNCEVVRQLLGCEECRVDIDQADDEGQTALMRAAEAMPLFVLRTSTLFGALGGASQGGSVLEQHQRRRDLEAGFECTVRAIVTASPRLDLTDRDGNTALHHAAESHVPAGVALLLENGAAVAPRNARGLTPLDLAQEQAPRNREVVELLAAAQQAAKKKRGGRD